MDNSIYHSQKGIKHYRKPLNVLSLNILRLLMFVSYTSYILIVPFCYTRIYIFRKNHVMPGQGKHHEEQVKRRRKRNNVTYVSNMMVWCVEAFSTILVISIVAINLLSSGPLLYREERDRHCNPTGHHPPTTPNF